MKLVELTNSNLAEAYGVFSDAYLRQCAKTPSIDKENARAEKILPMLEWCLKNHKGMAAYENGRMIGYMTGFYIDRFHSPHKGAYSPEWANCSIEEGAFEIYRKLYQTMGQVWMDDGCLTHVANTMNISKGAQEAFFWNGFGSICIDAVREVTPFGAVRQEELWIRPIEEADVAFWLPLVERHYVHLSKAPAFKPYLAEDRETAAELAAWLKEEGNHAWIAWCGDTATGYMKLSPSEDGAAWMVGGASKFAVNGAYVRPEFRDKGIAGALLDEMMVWGESQGFCRCSVDFEATNLEACHFWLRYFQPVCRSVIRRLDEGILNSLPL